MKTISFIVASIFCYLGVKALYILGCEAHLQGIEWFIIPFTIFCLALLPALVPSVMGESGANIAICVAFVACSLFAMLMLWGLIITSQLECSRYTAGELVHYKGSCYYSTVCVEYREREWTPLKELKKGLVLIGF